MAFCAEYTAFEATTPQKCLTKINIKAYKSIDLEQYKKEKNTFSRKLSTDSLSTKDFNSFFLHVGTQISYLNPHLLNFIYLNYQKKYFASK